MFDICYLLFAERARMAIIATAIAASTIIFTSHALPDHRVNFYLFIKTCKCQILAIYLAACSSGWFWPKYFLVLWSWPWSSTGIGKISNCLNFFLSKVCCVLMFWFQIPTWENPGDCICICRQDGSQIWLILNRDYWGGRIEDRGRRLIDFCKTGQQDSPQSPFCPNTLSAVCRLRGISRSGGAFYQICKSPSNTLLLPTTNNSTIPLQQYFQFLTINQKLFKSCGKC